MNKRAIILAAIILIGIFLRTTAINERPIHHDEVSAQMIGVHLLNYGAYTYDPEFHGPATFYLVALSIKLFGNTQTGLRTIHLILSIIALIIIPVLFATWRARIVCASLLVISPTILYYSSYAYFESTWLITYSIWLMAAIAVLFKDDHHPAYIYAFLCILTLMHATHEFTYVIIAGFLAFLITEHLFVRITQRNKDSALQHLKKSFYTRKIHWAYACTAATILFLALWSVGFSSVEQVPTSLTKSVTYNFQKSTAPSGHDKPFYYYPKLLVALETPLVLLLILSFFPILAPKTLKPDGIHIPRDERKRKKESQSNRQAATKELQTARVLLLLQAIFITSLIVLCITRYKTPWGLMLLIPPLVIIGAYTSDLLSHLMTKSWVLLWLVAASIILVVIQLAVVNYVHPTNELHNPLSYVQTKEDLWAFEKHITEIAPERILIIGSERQILGWVLKGHNVTYEPQRNPTQTDIMKYDAIIADDSNMDIGTPSFDFTIRPGVYQTLYYRADSTTATGDSGE